MTLVVAGVIVGAPTATAFASQTPEEPEPAPALSVVGPENVVFEISESDGIALGSATIVVLNSGGREALVQVAAVQLDDPPGGCSVALVESDAIPVPANRPATVPVTLRAPPPCADETGTVVLVSAPGSAPASARFALARTDVGLEYLAPAILALLAALLLALSLVRIKHKTPSIDLGPAFSFKDSWLTTVSTLTAIIGTILTTTGVVESLLPGIETDKLLTLNFVFGALVLAGPVAYTALATWDWVEDQKTKKQEHRTFATPSGLVVASCTTLAGVIGLVATVGILVWEAVTVPSYIRLALAGGLVLVALGVLSYAYRWTASALKRPADGTPPLEPVVTVENGQTLVRPPEMVADRGLRHEGSGTL